VIDILNKSDTKQKLIVLDARHSGPTVSKFKSFAIVRTFVDEHGDRSIRASVSAQVLHREDSDSSFAKWHATKRNHEKQCALCLKTRTLQRSHLIGKVIYALNRDDDNDPVMMTPERTIITSRQMWQHLLCRDCEQLIS